MSHFSFFLVVYEEVWRMRARLVSATAESLRTPYTWMCVILSGRVRVFTCRFATRVDVLVVCQIPFRSCHWCAASEEALDRVGGTGWERTPVRAGKAVPTPGLGPP